MERQFRRHWIIITNIILCIYTQQVHLLNNDCTADEELNSRLATLTKVYTEALNRKIQEELELFYTGSQEELSRGTESLTKVYTEALNKKIQEEVDQYCSGSQEDSGTHVPVVLTDNENIISGASSLSTLGGCIAYCNQIDDFLFYDGNHMICNCNPDLRLRLYVDIFNSTEINRVYTHPDDIYISCSTLSSGVADNSAEVWTNKQVDNQANNNSSDPWIAHILPCDMSDGGWTVIQRRVDGAVDFDRSWIDYVDGFGNAGGNFWIGLEAIYQLTAAGPVSLRITLETWEDSGDAVIFYSSFRLENGADKYRLRIGGYSGTVGDGLPGHNGNQFSTRDQDNDSHDRAHCAQLYPGGWWFNSCHSSQLNGIYQNVPWSEYGIGVQWYPYKRFYYSFKGASMSIF